MQFIINSFKKAFTKDQNNIHQKINYPLCNLHSKEPKNYVCLNTECSTKGLICAICKNQTHNSHNILPLKIFINQLNQYLQTINNSQGPEKYLQQLENIYHNLLQKLQSTVIKLAQVVKQTQITILHYYNKQKQRIIDQCLVIKQLPKLIQMILDSTQGMQAIVGEVDRIIKLIEFNPKKKNLSVDYNPDGIIKQYQTKNKVLDKWLLESEEKFRETWAIVAKIINNQKIVNAPIVLPYKFSDTLKANSIILSNNNLQAKQTQSNNGDLRFVIIDQPLDLQLPSKITFQVVKIKNWIGIGICFKNSIKNKGYKFLYQKIDHGSYLISSNGYTWSDSRLADNIKLQSFQFTTGDRITVTFQPTKKHLLFEKKQNNFILAIDIQTKKNEQICFCANLCSLEDQIAII